MAVLIQLISHAASGGVESNSIRTTEYADSAAAVAALVTGVLPVLTPIDNGSGVALKKKHIPLTSIKTIDSL